MIGPREELIATSSLGPAGVALLYSTVRKVIRVRNVPPPPGSEHWTSDAVTEAAHAVFAERGPQRLLTLAARSTDEESFRAGLWTLVANDLVSQGRRSERGKLAERLKSVLADMPAVHLREGRYHLDGAAGLTDAIRFDELVTAAARVAVRVPAWDPLSPNAPPVADRESLEALVHAVLGKAPLRLGELVAVIGARLGIHDAPDLAEEHALEAAMPLPSDPAQEVEEADAAYALLDALSEHEQAALPHLDASAVEVATALGLGKTKAWQVQRAARLKAAQMLSDSPQGARVLGRAVEIVQAREGERP